MWHFVLNFVSAGMSGLWLLNGDIDKGHRGAIWYERKLEPLVTRTPKENWKIHTQDGFSGTCFINLHTDMHING